MPEQQTQSKVADAFIGVAGFLLSAAFPAIPAVAWVAILTAVRNGDVILADIEAICASKGITIQYAESDFPIDKNGTFPSHTEGADEGP